MSAPQVWPRSLLQAPLGRLTHQHGPLYGGDLVPLLCGRRPDAHSEPSCRTPSAGYAFRERLEQLLASCWSSLWPSLGAFLVSGRWQAEDRDRSRCHRGGRRTTRALTSAPWVTLDSSRRARASTARTGSYTRARLGAG